jgi:nucleoside-diphosphate-sugar epimerase
MTRTVLISGGSGFIGSHLCEHLLGRGDRVICVDDLSTGRNANIAHLGDLDSFRFIRADVCEPAPRELLELIEVWGLNVVAHLASSASPPAYLARPIETLDVGSIGTRRLLGLAEDAAARFVLASTSEVYGDPLEHPQVETYWGNVNPIGERSVYDESKRFAEALTMAMHRSRQMDVGIVRIFNTYGPRLQPSDGRVVSNFVAQALAGKPFTIFGDGSQTRSFCYVDDLVAGLVAMLDGSEVGPINLGNPGEFTLLELAEIVAELCEVPLEITFSPLPNDDPRMRRPDINLAQQLLGWNPQIALREGLISTIEWQRSR